MGARSNPRSLPRIPSIVSSRFMVKPDHSRNIGSGLIPVTSSLRDINEHVNGDKDAYDVIPQRK